MSKQLKTRFPSQNINLWKKTNINCFNQSRYFSEFKNKRKLQNMPTSFWNSFLTLNSLLLIFIKFWKKILISGFIFYLKWTIQEFKKITLVYFHLKAFTIITYRFHLCLYRSMILIKKEWSLCIFLNSNYGVAKW